MASFMVLVCLTLGSQLVNANLPIVQEVPCVPQNWPDNQDASRWEQGQTYQHQGTDVSEKPRMTKIADFFITLIGNYGLNAAIYCTAEVDGGEIDAFWVSRANDKPEEDTESFIFGYGKDADGNDIRNRLRFGARGKFGEHEPKVRVELYGKQQPSGARVTCASGRHGGRNCPTPTSNFQINVEIRNVEENT